MAIDFANEKYVRVYVRDTMTLTLLSWQARALLWEIMRKADRSGVIDVGGHGARGIAAVTRIPLDAVEPAIKELIDVGTLQVGEGCFILPRFIEAQETSSSDKKRQKETRERRRAKAMGDETSQPVTKRDETSQNVTDSHDASHDVTSGHTASHGVTLSCAVPNLSEPSFTLSGQPEEPKAKKAVKRALPEDWAPNAKHAAKAQELGVQLGKCAEEFRNYWGARGDTMKNWDLAFNSWLSNAVKFAARANSGFTRPAEPKRVIPVFDFKNDPNAPDPILALADSL